jgi:single-strand DNA-binding protein
MASLNKVLLMGNLTRDPELRYTPSGAAVCELGLAVNRRYRTAQGEDRDEVCFVDIQVWGKQAESCNTYLNKGSQAFVEGRLRFDQWDDRESGKKRSRLTVTAERVQFMSPAGGRQEGGAPPQQRQQTATPQPPVAEPPPPFPNQDPPGTPAPQQQQAPQQQVPQQSPNPFDVSDDNEPIDDIPF